MPITVVRIVDVLNAINLTDGLDDLVGGRILFASLVNLIVSISSKSLISVFLMASVGGSTFGFLLYIWYPAKIYSGDGVAYSIDSCLQ